MVNWDISHSYKSIYKPYNVADLTPKKPPECFLLPGLLRTTCWVNFPGRKPQGEKLLKKGSPTHGQTKKPMVDPVASSTTLVGNWFDL